MFGGWEVATRLPRSPQEDPPEEAGKVEEVEEALVEAFWKTRLEVQQADDHDLGIYSNKGQRGTVDLHLYKKSASTAYKASERGLTNLEGARRYPRTPNRYLANVLLHVAEYCMVRTPNQAS